MIMVTYYKSPPHYHIIRTRAFRTTTMTNIIIICIRTRGHPFYLHYQSPDTHTRFYYYVNCILKKKKKAEFFHSILVSRRISVPNSFKVYHVADDGLKPYNINNTRDDEKTRFFVFFATVFLFIYTLS